MPARGLAIITSGLTASAGEQAVIALRAAKRTRTFGEPTVSFTTGVEIIDLGNGLLFLYSAAFPVDVHHTAYRERVTPQVIMEGGDNFLDLAGDRKIIAAMKWLDEN